MNPDALCMGCMTDSNGAATCSSCGYPRNARAESSAQLSPRTMLHGKYLVGRVLGQGGFGITYLAYDLKQNFKLAIKEYFPAFISTRASDRMSLTPLSDRNRGDLDYGLKRFYEEGQALFRFRNHPNVVRMIEFFHANGTGYIVMIYIEGCTFKEHLVRKGGKIPYAEALQPLNRVMDALRDLHSANILHRDISPDNIYLENGGGVRLLDFGATRYAMGEQSRSLSVVLKPGYAPEEQYRSRGHQGPWTDIYALGCTFYRAVTGQVPPESMDRLQSKPDILKDPSALGADIPPRAKRALLKALAVKAENRFQSIAELRAALGPMVEDVTEDDEEVHPRSRWFFLTAFGLLVLLIVVLLAQPSLSTQTSLLIANIVAQLLFFSLTLILFFVMWKAIQDGHARTSPAKAAGFTLIPIFNLFWLFRVLWGFSEDYNKFIDRHLIIVKKLNEPLFLLCSISLVAYWICGLFGGATAIVLLLIHACLLFPVVLNVCDGIDALAMHAPKKAAISGVKSTHVGQPPMVSGLALHCVGGEYQGEDIEIGDREIVIGRNATLANLVLSSGEVSAKHVRVWHDHTHAAAWVEDLHSTNGTFFKEARSPEDAWVRLSGGRLLSSGDRFRLSHGAAEFVVKMT
jgi:serine/threonine protein kinase